MTVWMGCMGTRHVAVIAGVLLTSCSSYAPPMQAERRGPAYDAALAACQEAAPGAVNKRNAKTGLDWFASPIRRPFQIRAEIRACLDTKGFPAPR